MIVNVTVTQHHRRAIYANITQTGRIRVYCRWFWVVLVGFVGGCRWFRILVTTRLRPGRGGERSYETDGYARRLT